MIIFIAMAIMYVFMCGLAYPLVLSKTISNCAYEGHSLSTTNTKGEHGTKVCAEYHKPGAVFMSLGGPVVIPFLMGSAVTNRSARLEVKHTNELEAAKRKREIAKVEAETLAIQEKSLGLNS